MEDSDQAKQASFFEISSESSVMYHHVYFGEDTHQNTLGAFKHTQTDGCTRHNRFMTTSGQNTTFSLLHHYAILQHLRLNASSPSSLCAPKQTALLFPPLTPTHTHQLFNMNPCPFALFMFLFSAHTLHANLRAGRV